jgi:hypothetical protein
MTGRLLDSRDARSSWKAHAASGDLVYKPLVEAAGQQPLQTVAAPEQPTAFVIATRERFEELGRTFRVGSKDGVFSHRLEPRKRRRKSLAVDLEAERACCKQIGKPRALHDARATVRPWLWASGNWRTVRPAANWWGLRRFAVRRTLSRTRSLQRTQAAYPRAGSQRSACATQQPPLADSAPDESKSSLQRTMRS